MCQRYTVVCISHTLTPLAKQLEFYTEMRCLFAEGFARGTAAVSYPGATVMIDVPADERARLHLALWELGAAHDTAKAAALRKAQTGSE